MKVYCLIFCLFLSFIHISTSTDINCSFEYYSFTVIGNTYHCDIRYDPNIISEETAVVNSAIGTHESYRSDYDVTGIYSSSKKIEVFPRGLEKIFKNLKLIAIYYGRLTEVHQADLKPFTKLVYLSLANNDIKIIEEGLFDFNPKLAFISFAENKILQIHSTVFNNLKELRHLILEGNACTNRRADSSVFQVKYIIGEFTAKCQYTGSTAAAQTTTTEWTTTKTTEWEDSSIEEFVETTHAPHRKSQSVQHKIHNLVISLAVIINAVLRF
ncbi:hypothetical protein ACKWTF_015148 [Chironomus riparius]